MQGKTNHRNEYQCTIEVNQNGKYCVRVRASFARKAWVLPVYFLASTFDRAMRKLEQVLQFLQQKEERLWFWGVEFPRRSSNVALSPEKPVPAVLLAPVRRGLAHSIDTGRVSSAGN